MSPYILGARLASAQLRGKLLTLGFALMALLVASIGLLERTESLVGAADRSLLGVVFGWALPLTTFFIVSDISGQARLASGNTRLGRYGQNQRKLLLGELALGCVLTLTFVLIYAWLALGITAPTFGWALVSDALTTSWIAALGTFAYIAWFAFWSTWGRHGGGRIIGLLLDWALGLGTSFGAALFPRAHLRNLLGDVPPITLAQSTSTAVLVSLTLLLLAAALRRVDP